MWWWDLGGVVRLEILVPSYHNPEAVPRADMAYGFVDNIHVVGTVSDFITVGRQSWFVLHESFHIFAIAPRPAT